jgi:hypothetical protein
MYTTWQRSVHSVPHGERIAAAVTLCNLQNGHLTAPWPEDTAPPGTRALAVRCHMVNVSIGVFVSDMYLLCRSDKRQLSATTFKVADQNTTRGCTR